MKKQGFQNWKEYAVITSHFFRKQGTKFPHIKYVNQLVREEHI